MNEGASSIARAEPSGAVTVTSPGTMRPSNGTPVVPVPARACSYTAYVVPASNDCVNVVGVG